MKKEIIIYSYKNKDIKLSVDTDKETIWATQAEIAELFDVTPQNITLHLNNIFKDKELEIKATCKESLQIQIEGKREIKRTVKFYNLDAIIAVGYRINSVMGTNFRIWAIKTLKEHITKGYTINKNRIAENYNKFLETVENIKNLLPAGAVIDNKDVVALISLFADTWLSLDAYDKEIVPKGKLTKRKVGITAQKILENLAELKQNLSKKGEASEIFGVERNKGNVSGIFGNIMQTFGGKELYPSVEEKAVHLLYFMIKNHPFIDGNKRSGAFSFIYFLQQGKILNINKNYSLAG